jgi:hypothetical protein
MCGREWVIWYEVINSVHVITVDGGPAADDAGSIAITVPDGHRMVAHAVRRAAVEEATRPQTAQAA